MKPRQESILTLDRSASGKHIPDIQLSISDQFFIKKLNVREDAEAMMAYQLRIHYNPESRPTTVNDTLTNEKGAYYVLIEKSKSLSDPHQEKIVAYAYAKKASDDLLVFEYLNAYEAKESDHSMIQDAYIELADHLIKRSDISKIYCGFSTKKRVDLSIGIFDVTIPSQCSAIYKGTWGMMLNLVADKNLFVSLNKGNQQQFDYDAWQSEIALCEKSKSITQKMRTNIRWIFSNSEEQTIKRPIDSELIEGYFSTQEKFKEKLQTYSNTHKEFKLPPTTEDVDFNLPVTHAINKSYTVNATAAMIAAHLGHESFLSELLSRHNNVNFKNDEHRDALFYASISLYGNKKLKNDKVKHNESCINLLMEAKADILQTDYVGQTPILLATIYNDKSQIKSLLEAKADINTLGISSATPLMNATRNYVIGNHETPDALHYLIEAKANINLQQQEGTTALIYAVENCGVDNQKEALETVKCLLDAKADPKISNHKNETALSFAKERHYETIIQLLEPKEKSDPKVTPKNSPTLFHRTVKNPKTESQADEPQAAPKASTGFHLKSE